MMRRLAILLLFVSASAALAQQIVQTNLRKSLRPRWRKVMFPDPGRSSLIALEQGGTFEVIEVRKGRVVALERIDPAEEHLLPGPQPEGLTVLQSDIDEDLAVFKAKGSEGAYHSVAESESELKNLVKRYPALCRLESIGKTFEGRDIWALRITGAPDPAAVPRLLIFGLVHAREWMSVELPFFVINKLLTGYGSDPETKKLVDSRCLWVIPIVNPDGLAYSQGQYTMWRKNRSKRASSVGVDINRNFEVGWGLGSSSNPGSDTYRGANAYSEEETRALMALVQRERFTATLGLHSYSQLVTFPWGKSSEDPPGKETLVRHGKAMGQANGYRPGSVAQILYISGGGTNDTFFSKCGCWSWTFELGTEFVPPESEIQPLCAKNWPAVLYLIRTLEELGSTEHPFAVLSH